MAVFTTISQDELNSLMQNYALGSAIELQGISSGIENSNFFLTTTQGKYVLTIFEHLEPSSLSYYLNLIYYLSKQGILAPQPILRNDGQLFGIFNNKPVAIVSILKGETIQEPTHLHCALIGKALAQLHLVGQDFSQQQPNLRSLSWWQQTVPLLEKHVSASKWSLLQSELNTQEDFFNSIEYAALPAGQCHCDLFRDNVLFIQDKDYPPQLSGILDFYFAGYDKWLFDLAVTVNDWCLNADTQLNKKRYNALIQHYQAIRPFTQDEHQAWPLMLRAAAYRFWVSRLYDYYYPRNSALLMPHDPEHFENILKARISTPASLSIGKDL